MCVCLDYEQVREWRKMSNIAHVAISLVTTIKINANRMSGEIVKVNKLPNSSQHQNHRNPIIQTRQR